MERFGSIEGLESEITMLDQKIIAASETGDKCNEKNN